LKLTAITCTYNRPEAFALCKEYMANQTRQPDQWLILDGPEPMREKIRHAAISGAIEGDAVVWFEDDDIFKPGWLEWCAAQMEHGYELAGEGLITYYNVSRRWAMECMNTKHAALCATCMSTDLLPQLVNVIDSQDSPFFDLRLWHLSVSKRLRLTAEPKDRFIIGIKGMPGAKGYSSEHENMPEWGKHDPGMDLLIEWLGADWAKRYAQFHTPQTEVEGHWPNFDPAFVPVDAAELPWHGHLAGPLVAVVQYWDGDAEEAMKLISVLEKNRDPRFLQVDAFRSTGVGYPKGPNEAAETIMRTAVHNWPHASGILLLEPDCVPMCPGWDLILHGEWSRAQAAGKIAMGSYRPLGTKHGHLNGNLIFDPLPMKALVEEVGPCPPDLAWDLFYAEKLLEQGARTGLIRNLWRERWVPRERILTPECGKAAPVLIHGVIDNSAWDISRENFNRYA